jgi:8-hydroxy-5-deazaflavin:NADPH oxidoreductase
VRHPQEDKVREVVKATPTNARAGSVADAAAFGEVVVLATPWPATQAAIQSTGDLVGKIVIDRSSPLKPDLSGLEIGHTTSAAEKVAERARGARVFKAFNTIGFNVMADPVIEAGGPSCSSVETTRRPGRRFLNW